MPNVTYFQNKKPALFCLKEKEKQKTLHISFSKNQRLR